MNYVKAVIGIIITSIVIVIIISLITSEFSISETKPTTVFTDEPIDEKIENIPDSSDGYKEILEFLALEEESSFHLVTKGKIPSYNDLNISNSTLDFG